MVKDQVLVNSFFETDKYKHILSINQTEKIATKEENFLNIVDSLRVRI